MLLRAAMMSICLAGLAGSASADETATAARFSVLLLGVKVGEFTLAGSESARAYTASGRFATTGVARAARRVAFSMQARGRRAGDAFRPIAYSERVEFGDRTGDAGLDYRNRVPVLIGSKPGNPGAPVLDPRRQRDTVDPLTVLFAIARDQPFAGLCQIDQPVYDGVRRTKVVLDQRRTLPDGRVECTGRFERIGGYTQEQLAEARRFPMTVTYRAGDTSMQVERVRIDSTFGALELRRR